MKFKVVSVPHSRPDQVFVGAIYEKQEFGNFPRRYRRLTSVPGRNSGTMDLSEDQEADLRAGKRVTRRISNWVLEPIEPDHASEIEF
jgi:hypothetical protein